MNADTTYLEAIEIARRVAADEREWGRLRRAAQVAYRLQTGRRVPDWLLLRESTPWWQRVREEA